MLSQRTRASPIRWVWRRLSSSFVQVVDDDDKAVAIPSVERILGPGGLLAARDTSYEHRQAQIDMASHVYNTLSQQPEGNPLIIEAGTGVGKTLAYLIPAVLVQMSNRKRSSGKPIFVATNTKALQDQIMVKEKPLIEAMLGSKIKIEPAFGRQNYISKRLLNEAEDRAKKAIADKTTSVPQDRKRLQVLRNLISKENELSFTGKFDEFDGQIDEETISEIQSNSNNCRGKDCGNFLSCYYYAAKRIMEIADIVVINHHLLLADVQIAIQKSSEVGFLIDFDKLIIDEAHELESVAAHVFLNKISWKRIMARFDKIHNENGKKHILKNIPLNEVRSILDELAECRRKMHSLFEKLCGEFDHSKTKREKLDVLPTKSYGSDDCDLVADCIERLCERLNGFVALQMKEAGGFSEENELRILKSGYTVKDFIAEVRNLMVLVSDIRRWLAGVEGRSDDSTVVFWIEYCRNGKDDNIKKEDLTMCSSPLTPGQTLREHLFRPNRAVVLTSATIDVDRSFVNFKLLVGLNEVDTKDIALKSPYDIEKQAEVLTLQDELKDHGSLIRKYILDGQAIVLFTSYESLEETYKSLHTWMEQEGINAFVQRKEKRFLDVVEDFKANSKGVLFATSSGWQGVDIKGDALKTVIITKIPFSSDFGSVLAKARKASLKAKNLDYFVVYSLPAATIKLLQGVGRLIRSKTDTGKIIILDHRLHSESYGNYIKAALISKGYIQQILD